MKKKVKEAAKKVVKAKKSIATGLKKANKMDTGKVKSQNGLKSIKEPC